MGSNENDKQVTVVLTETEIDTNAEIENTVDTAVEADVVSDVNTNPATEVEDALTNVDSTTAEIDVPKNTLTSKLKERQVALLTALKQKKVLISLIALLAIALIGGVSYFAYESHVAEQARIMAEEKAAQEAKLKAEKEAVRLAEVELVADFNSIVEIRTTILAAESKVNTAVSDAKAAQKKYTDRVRARDEEIERLLSEYDRKYEEALDWNFNYDLPGYKEYPSSPNLPANISKPKFKKQIAALKEADSEVRDANAKLGALDIDEQLSMLLSQLKESCMFLSEEALHNADTLATAVDSRSLKTLRTGAPKAILTVANNSCLHFMQEHEIDVRLYDIAGGSDISIDDSSMLTGRE